MAFTVIFYGRLCHMIRLSRLFYVYNDKNKHIKMSDKIFFGKSYTGQNKYLHF